MPVVFRYKGFRFFFYSNEGDPLEPLHIHVRKAECVAKLWLEPGTWGCLRANCASCLASPTEPVRRPHSGVWCA